MLLIQHNVSETIPASASKPQPPL